MKNRDEFMDSVWAKSEQAAAREKTKKKKIGKYAGALAACLVLGIGTLGAMPGLTEQLFGGPAEVSSEGSVDLAAPQTGLAAPEASPEASEKNEIYMSGVTDSVTSDQEKGSVSGETNAYYALPDQIEVEDIEKGIATCYREEADIITIMDWFYTLQEEGKTLNGEEFQEDTEGDIPEDTTYKLKFFDKIYYVIGEVESFE